MTDHRTRSQRWADKATEFSGSWSFIVWFVVLCMAWIAMNAVTTLRWDPYPFLFLNWILMAVGTFQNPLVLLSQNRQNETNRDRIQNVVDRLETLQRSVDDLKRGRD